MAPAEPSGDGSGELPARIGRFEVLGELGQGGMGRVLRARDPRLAREVAIKLLRDEGAADRPPRQIAIARQRLVREAQAMARLAHPNVIAVHEVGEEDGRVYLVMERVEGTTLAGWLAAAPRPWRAILDMFDQLAAGLAAAHAAGLVHRDVKPDNVLVGDDGRVRVTDFGLVGVDGPAGGAAAISGPALLDDAPASAHGDTLPATLTHAGAMIGTPGYMAPEQLRGDAADPRSDQFGLCVALYEALFGQPPFAGDTYRARMAAVLDGAVRPPPTDGPVPPAVTAAVLRGLSGSPDDRWPDVAALRAALADAALEPAPAADAAPAAATSAATLAAAAPPPPAPAPPAARRRRTAAIAGALAATGALAAGAAVVGPRLRAGAPDRAPAAPAAPPRPAARFPLPAGAVETVVDSGGCDGQPVLVDDRTLVYRRADAAGIDLRVRDLVTGDDRALTATPDVDEMSPQPAVGERAVVAIPRHLTASGAGAARIDLATGLATPLPAGAAISFGQGAIAVGERIYYVLGLGTQLMELARGEARERATFAGGIGTMAIDARGGRLALFTGSGACTIDLATDGAPACLTDLDGPYGEPGIDLAGRLFYAGLAGLRRRDPATGEDVLLVADRGANGGLAVSATGDALYFSECQPQMEITDVGSGAVVHRESLTHAAVNRLGAWAFVRETPSASLLAYLDPDGLVQVLTRPAQGFAADLALAPEGDRIAFNLGGGPEPGLYLARGQSHQPVRRIREAELAGLVWLDDHRVAGSVLADDGRPRLEIVDVDTGASKVGRPLPRYVFDRQPDGDLVLLASEDRARLFVWDPARDREREVKLPAGLANRVISAAALGPGARDVHLVIGPTVWRLPLAPPGAPSRVYAPPGRKAVWGIEVDRAGRLFTLLSEERGALYRLRLPP